MCAQVQQMKSSTKNDPKSLREIAYYQQRYRNRVFAKLVTWITEQAQKQQLTKKDIAERIRKDPGLISRLLGGPSNLTLDTISDLLLAFDAEAEPPEIMLFKDKPTPNFVHPLMARALHIPAPKTAARAQATNTGEKTVFTERAGSIAFKSGATAG
jgi:transcriptional regulator with XRE-family HTH domain